MALNLEGTIRLTYNVKNDLQVLINPATAVLTITQPDGTTTTPTVTLPPTVTGVLVVDFTPTQSGLHSVHWKTTVPNTAEDDVFVAEPAGTMLVSVDEAVERLNAAGILTSDLDREKLQWRCMAATDAVERDLGRVLVRRTVTETFDGGQETIVLHSRPIISITTVTESGSAVVAGNYVPNYSAGLLHRGGTNSVQAWSAGRQNVTVAYVAGYANPPRSAREVALAAVQELWQTSQQAEHPLLDEMAELAVQGAAAVLPGPLRGAYNRLRITDGA